MRLRPPPLACNAVLHRVVRCCSTAEQPVTPRYKGRVPCRYFAAAASRLSAWRAMAGSVVDHIGGRLALRKPP